MNTQLRRWIDVGPMPCSATLCARARVALVELEVVAGVVLGLGPHDAIAGDLGEDRRRRDRQAARVALHDASGVVPPPTKSHLPSSSTRSGVHAEVVEGAPGGQPLGLRHAELVALLLAGVADRPGDAPVGDPIEQRLALALGEHLRVADLVDAPILGHHGGARA